MSSKLLSQLNGYPQLEPFFSRIRAKSQWGTQDYKAADESLEKALQVMEEDDQYRLAGWMCSEQVARSCSYAAGTACKKLGLGVEKERRLLLNPTIALAYIKAQECEQGENIEYSPLIRYSVLDDARLLMMSMRYEQGGKRRDFQNNLVDLLRSRGLSEPFKMEVMHRLSRVIEDRPEIQRILLDMWRESEFSLAWQRVGQQFVKNYYRDGAFELAAKLGDRIVSKQNYLAPEFKQYLVLTNYKSGRQLRAWEVYNLPEEQGGAAARAVASSNEYNQIGRWLKKKFKRGSL